MCIAVSDQNFVPVWPGAGEGGCIPILRIENASLHELADVLMEAFEGCSFPDGSTVLMGSASYLHRVGTGQYAREWVQCVNRMGRKWPNCRVGPLIPIFQEKVPGGMVRELVELAAWYSKVYEGQIQGFGTVWTQLLSVAMRNGEGLTVLENTAAYTITLPISLDANTGFAPTTYYTNCSRPSILNRMDQGNISELLGSIASFLVKNMKIDIGGIPANVCGGDGPNEPILGIILVGASNLKRVAFFLEAAGFKVLDLCEPGWVANPENVSAVRARLVELG
jgi:hypothetical protein